MADPVDRTHVLISTGIAISSELSLEAVLQRVLATAAELTGAAYAALGVIDPSGKALERFLTHGIGADAHAAIGELPRGRGILGALIADATPLRLERIADDPRSVGFPPNHPPMGSFLGVPILLRGVAYGNLYLTEKAGGEQFTEEDVELVRLLAAQAAVAIENARLYESATRWSSQLESLNEVGDALVSEIDLQRLHALVARRLRELLGCKVVAIGLPVGDRAVRWATADGEGAEQIVGTEASATDSKSGRILERKRSERIDSILDDPEVNVEMARILQMNAALWVPLLLREKAIGVLMAVDKLGGDPRFSDDDLRLAEAFAARASVAVDLSQRVARDSLRRVVAGQELERQRLARELHDETGQALTSILLGLHSVEEAKDAEARKLAVAELRELVTDTLHDVRRLAVELRPKALDDFGLVPALERLTSGFAETTGIAVELEAGLGDERLTPEIETALYRIVQEALTNVVKHARARRVSVVVTRRPGSVSTLIEDDGRGFEPPEDGQGLGVVGMRERVALLDGRLQIESGAQGGTTIAVEVPVG
jgi:signal transduction histidine kinase